jgi:2-polyprenyl-6-methoxyphenol hydroxylase-like FAD-dependent oxidoreductase
MLKRNSSARVNLIHVFKQNLYRLIILLYLQYPSPMSQIKILISGGGIAGNALAFWLSKLGHDVTVIERFPALRATGLQVDLRGHGIEVLKRMGLEQQFRAKSVKEEGMQVVSKSGTRWAFFPANRSGEGLQGFTTDLEIMRGDLCRLLYDATKTGVKYLFGTSIASIEENASAVEVLFSDGTKDSFDMVIGADGQGSRTRKIMLGEGNPNPIHSLGVYIAYFKIPRPIEKNEDYIASAYFAPKKRLVFTRRHSAREMQTYLCCIPDGERLKNIERGAVQEEKEAISECFHGAGGETEQLLESMRDANDFYVERLGVVRLPSWSQGRVALVGDAAYCPSATTGMGTTSSIVGAYILAGEIGRHCGRSSAQRTDKGNTNKNDISAAFKAYEEKFRPFMEQVQEGISEGSNYWEWMPSTPLGVVFVNLTFAIVSFFRLDIISKYVLREDVQGWNLPDYKDVLSI